MTAIRATTNHTTGGAVTVSGGTRWIMSSTTSSAEVATIIVPAKRGAFVTFTQFGLCEALQQSMATMARSARPRRSARPPRTGRRVGVRSTNIVLRS